MIALLGATTALAAVPRTVKISDLYVDMCPRQWRADDGDCSDDADLPLQRWEASGYHHWLGVPVQARLNRVEH